MQFQKLCADMPEFPTPVDATNAAQQDENAELRSGGIHWWQAMRAVSAVLGVAKLTDVKAAVERLKREYLELAAAVWACPPDEMAEGHDSTLAEARKDVMQAAAFRDAKDIEQAFAAGYERGVIDGQTGNDHRERICAVLVEDREKRLNERLQKLGLERVLEVSGDDPILEPQLRQRIAELEQESHS